MNVNDNDVIKKVIFTKVETKNELFNVLGIWAAKLKIVKKPQYFTKALKAREAFGSTGMVNGIAIPHAVAPQILKPAILIVKNHNPLNDYESLDNFPITLTICLSMPQKSQAKHLDLLANIAQKLSDQNLRMKLIQTQKEELIWKILS